MLTDEQWQLIDPYIPKSAARTGRPMSDRRLMFEAALYQLTSGCPWRALPRERFGCWQTAFHHFNRWRRDGVLDRLARAMLARVDAAGLVDWTLFCVDGTSVRAAACAAGARRASPRAANPRTTRWAAAAAGSARRCTSRRAATACR